MSEEQEGQSSFDYDIEGASEVAEEEKEEQPQTQEAEEEKEVDEQSSEEETTEQPQETETDDIEALRAQLAERDAEIFKLRSASQPQPEPQQPQPQPEPKPQPQSNELTNVDFLQGEEDYVKFLEDRDKFNGLLNKVATVAFNAAVMAAQERILRQIPSVVETAASQQLKIKDIVGNFYEANQDLVNYKPAVSMAAMQIHNENPSMPLEKVLNKAAERARTTLRIRPVGAQRMRVPAQPVGSGKAGQDRTAQPTKLTEQEQQILDLLS